MLVVFACANTPAQNTGSTLKRDALKHLQSGRYGEAIQLLNKYIAQNPGASDGYNLRGLCFENRSQLNNAVLDFRKGAQLSPHDKEIQRNLARVESALRISIEKKIEGHKRELARNPNSANEYLEIARLHSDNGGWKEAEGWYDEYVKRAEPSPDDLLRYGEVLAHNNQLAKGEKLLQKYTERYGDNAEVWTRYGYFLLWLGKLPNASKAFEKALSLRPDFPEAREGLNETKARPRVAASGESSPKPIPPSELAIFDYFRALRVNRKDEEIRFRLVNELIEKARFSEADRQLDTLSVDLADTIRIQLARQHATTVRDSVYQERIETLVERLKTDPADKDASLRIAGLYSELGDYGNAIVYLDLYLSDIPANEALDVRYKYAQYAAWGKQFDKAIEKANQLLAKDPTNADYQLLRGQIAVWSGKDLSLGERYLTNAYLQNANNIPAVLALSSLRSLQGNLREARDLLERAKRIDRANKDIRAVQVLYDQAVEAGKEHDRFATLTEARQLTVAGDCARALKKYDEYFAKTSSSPRFAMLEYADVNSCAKNFNAAVDIYDRLLNTEYDFDVAVLRAKNYLWRGDSIKALQEFKRLTAERPTDFMARLYLGETYQTMQNSEEARKIYQDLFDTTTDPNERKLIQDRMRYLPATGFVGAIAAFPTHMALSPPFTFYSDNQNFQISSYGGRVELGVLRMLSFGASFLRTTVNSPLSERQLTGFKGQMFLKVSDVVSAEGGYGTQATPGRPKVDIYDAAFRIEKPGSLSLVAQLQHLDAVQILYSPYLVDLPFTSTFYKFAVQYQNPARMIMAGSIKYLSISDGNNGNEIHLRLGRKWFDDASMGYEYVYTNYNHQAAYVPFTNRASQLYYSPQNLESHSGWVDWTVENSAEFQCDLGGRVGYIPAFNATLREFYGDIRFRPIPYVSLSGRATLGSSVRFDASYNYVSFALSAYVSFY